MKIQPKLVLCLFILTTLGSDGWYYKMTEIVQETHPVQIYFQLTHFLDDKCENEITKRESNILKAGPFNAGENIQQEFASPNDMAFSDFRYFKKEENTIYFSESREKYDREKVGIKINVCYYWDGKTFNEVKKSSYTAYIPWVLLFIVIVAIVFFVWYYFIREDTDRNTAKTQP